jgi:hypothetical protein
MDAIVFCWAETVGETPMEAVAKQIMHYVWLYVYMREEKVQIFCVYENREQSWVIRENKGF